jgi:hypothetical protein
VSTITGLARFTNGMMRTGPWQVTRASALLPGLPVGAEALGMSGAARGVASATERKPRAYESWLAYCTPPPEVDTIAIADTQPTADKKGRVVGGIFGCRHGQGGGVYASFRLWDRWEPGDPLFAAFHDAICSRRARYRLTGPFWPGVASLAVEEDGPTVVARSGGVVEVVAMGARDALHEGAYCATSAHGRGPRGGDVDLLVDAPSGGLYHLRRTPVAVRPYQGGCLSKLELIGPKALQIMLYGDEATVRSGAGGLRITRPVANDVEVVVTGGTYPVAPGSAHLVTAARERRDAVKQVVKADAAGRLDIAVRAQRTRVTIEPAPAR